MRVIMFLAWLLLPYLTVVHAAIELVGQAIKGEFRNLKNSREYKSVSVL